ncbi:unnamed protein product [Paramecium pentaurelia]|uniref:DUSP domain-containing protein n=1 Tax=Paramecium pentaurelia TaxID=43138 RepID=A0A8S1UU06_9CILI|nr:unnamed protein product [Paramecium pentaurelia]
MNIIDEILTIGNDLSGPQIFAICRKWYEQFQDDLFNFNPNFSKIDNYTLCICQEEEMQLNNVLNNFKREFNIQPIKPIIIQQNSQEQILKVDKRNQAHYVSKALWEFLQEQVKGGPCIPLYTMNKQESYLVRTMFGNLKFMTNNEIEDLMPNLVVPVDMTQMEFLIQKEDDSFIYFTKVVPLAFTIEQLITKIITPLFDISNLMCYNYYLQKFLSNKNSTFICELQKKSLWFLNSSMIISNGGMKFNENLDEVQMREDFQSLKTGSTESTTESRISSLIDITQPQINPLYKFDNEGNPINLMLRDLDDFKNEISTILKQNKNQPLVLLKYEQAIENINQIIQQIEQEYCFKKEQQEEGTNDELIEQDI